MIQIWNRRDGHTPEGVKYVGRPISFVNPFGNPFIVGVHGTREECVQKHKTWLENGEAFGNKQASRELRQIVLAALPELKGKDLECWCFPLPCHANTLVEMANK